MSMADRDGSIWFDGQFVPWREAQVHVLTHTLHYGMGVFEGVRAYQTDRGPAIFRLRYHTKRFCNSSNILHMASPSDAATLTEAQSWVNSVFAYDPRNTEAKALRMKITEETLRRQRNE